MLFNHRNFWKNKQHSFVSCERAENDSNNSNKVTTTATAELLCLFALSIFNYAEHTAIKRHTIIREKAERHRKGGFRRGREWNDKQDWTTKQDLTAGTGEERQMGELSICLSWNFDFEWVNWRPDTEAFLCLGLAALCLHLYSCNDRQREEEDNEEQPSWRNNKNDMTQRKRQRPHHRLSSSWSCRPGTPDSRCARRHPVNKTKEERTVNKNVCEESPDVGVKKAMMIENERDPQLENHQEMKKQIKASSLLLSYLVAHRNHLLNVLIRLALHAMRL